MRKPEATSSDAPLAIFESIFTVVPPAEAEAPDPLITTVPPDPLLPADAEDPDPLITTVPPEPLLPAEADAPEPDVEMEPDALPDDETTVVLPLVPSNVTIPSSISNGSISISEARTAAAIVMSKTKTDRNVD